MNSTITILMAEAIAVYALVLLTHALRRRAGLAPFYALLGGITAVMSWITDAGVAVNVGGITFMVGSTVFYTSLLLGVFVIYVFDGPVASRIAISTIAGVSILVPLIAVVLHMQMTLTGQADLTYIPIPSLRINSASVIATIADLLFLGMVWEILGNRRIPVGLGIRAFATLLGVMWLDVLLFGTGAFMGTPEYLGILKGTFVSRLVIALFAWPFLYAYLRWQSGRHDTQIENRPVLAILREVAQIRGELGSVQRELEQAKRGEDALRESEERFKQVADNAQVWIWETDAKGLYRYSSPVVEDILGYTPAELVGQKHFYDFFDPNVKETLTAGALGAFQSKQPFSKFINPNVHKDGRIVILETSGTPMLDAQGNLIGYRGTDADVTDRTCATEALQASQEKFRSIVDNLGIGIALISPRMEILELNRQMQAWFPSVTPGDGVLCYAHFNSPPQSERCTYCPTIKTLRDGGVHEAITETPSGDRVRRYRIVASPVLDAVGSVTAAIEMVEDITDRMEMEAQLQQQRKLASVGALARGMAHELNNPINGIMNYAQLVLDRLGPDTPVAEFALEIGKEAERVARMTHSLLNFTQLQDSSTFASVQLAEMAASILATVEMDAKKRRIALSCKIADDLPLVRCKLGRIGRVLAALLDNALEAFADDPEGHKHDRSILLSARAIAKPGSVGEVGRVRITIEDTGPGIPTEIRGRVFDPFFSTKDRTQHSGLGLWISRSVAQEHGAEMTITSPATGLKAGNAGRGTRVHFDLAIAH